MSAPKVAISPSVSGRKNQQLYILFARQEFDKAIALADQLLAGPLVADHEYALFIKGMILRNQGDIVESLKRFQQAMEANPRNPELLKQVARSLFLLGRFKGSLEVYAEAVKLGGQDWETLHSMGLCHMNMKDFEDAIKCFQEANKMYPHDSTFAQLGKTFILMNDYDSAIKVLEDAVDRKFEGPELLTTLGLLCLRADRTDRALEVLRRSLRVDPRNPKAVIATASILQDQNHMEEALLQYRVAAQVNPNNPQLWNNIGMCFFAKQQHVGALACLKKALYLGPFEWITCHNLGLVHLSLGQYCSAFHYFSAAVNLNPNFAQTYMYLGVTLAKLEDFENAGLAYEKCISLDALDHLCYFNYSVALLKAGQTARASDMFVEGRAKWLQLEEKQRNGDASVLQLMRALEGSLHIDPIADA